MRAYDFYSPVLALILIGYKYVKELRLANENLRIPEDTISMPKMARIWTCSLCSSVELGILFQNGRSAFFWLKLGFTVNNHLALCIDNNDNHANDFCLAYSLFVSLVTSSAPSLRSRANDATRATNNLYTLQKSYDCPITQYRILVTVEDMVFGHLAPKLHRPVWSTVQNFPSSNSFPSIAYCITAQWSQITDI